MPLSAVSKFYAVSDAKIAKLTADPAGGTATYATSIDVPGIKGVTISGNIKTSELRGDNQLLDSNSTLTNITCSISYAKLSVDVLPVVLGGATAAAGVTPNQTQTYTLGGTDTFSYFRLEARTPTGGSDSVTGSANITLHKLILSSFPDMGFSEEDYKIFAMEATAVPLLATGNKWLTVSLNETAVALA